MTLLPGVRSQMARTDRLEMRYIESGPADGIPVVMIHGNLATGRFFEHVMPGAPDEYRFIAPDMRGFGDTERVPIDGARGLRDWADDTFSLVRKLGITRPAHLVGWSTGGAAIANYAEDRAVASLTFIDPVSPYGFGGTKVDALLPRLRRLRWWHRQPRVHEAPGREGPLDRIALLAAERHEQLLLGRDAPRAQGARGAPPRRGPEVGDRS